MLVCAGLLLECVCVCVCFCVGEQKGKRRDVSPCSHVFLHLSVTLSQCLHFPTQSANVQSIIQITVCVCVRTHVHTGRFNTAHLLLLGDVEDTLHCEWKDALYCSSETGGGEMNHILPSSRCILSSSSLALKPNWFPCLRMSLGGRRAKENTHSHLPSCVSMHFVMAYFLAE